MWRDRFAAGRVGPALAVVAVVAVVALGGCYRKVVGARGLGTGGTQIQKPTEPSFLDRMLGPAPSSEPSAPRIRVN